MFTPQRDPRDGLYGPMKPPSPFRLIAGLVLVFLAMWYLSRYAG